MLTQIVESEGREPSEITQTAAAVGGALAGTALTLAAGPFVGSASGEAIARVLLRIGYEIERRVLAPREERRIGAAYEAARDAAAMELRAGHGIRSDGFFDRSMPDAASPAEEILEGVLRTASEAWEERKVPYIGRIGGTLSFDLSVSPADASYLLKLADRLTYQQFVLIAFWEAVNDADRSYRQEVLSAMARISEGISRPTATIVAEMDGLADAGLLGVINSSGELVPLGQTMGGVGGVGGLLRPGRSSGDIDLTSLRLTDMGATLYRLMGLNHVPDSDLTQIARALHGPT